MAELIGRDLFAQACEMAWATAAATGVSSAAETIDEYAQWSEDVHGVAHALADLVWDEREPPEERVKMLVALYEAMPSYAVLMYAWGPHRDFGAARKVFWDAYRRWLSDEDARLARPVSYSLWVDFFESPGSVEEAWREVSGFEAPYEKRLERVLVGSGPVPYDLKADLYESLLPLPRWHYFIFRSLLHSVFDVYGQIELSAARRVFRRLSVAPGTDNLELLTDRLFDGVPPR